jgi:hypothetical protein
LKSGSSSIATTAAHARLDTRAAVTEHAPARCERCVERATKTRGMPRRHISARNRASAAMNGKREFLFRIDRARH